MAARSRVKHGKTFRRAEDRRRPPVELLRQVVAYDPETGLFAWLPRPPEMFASPSAAKAWATKHEGKPAFTVRDGTGRLEAEFLGYRVAAHRAAWAHVYGEWPPMLDHIDRDPLNNRIANLRVTTTLLNAQNWGDDDRTPGIEQRPSGWTARLTTGGWTRRLGTFATREDAEAARVAGIARYFDDDGNLKPTPQKSRKKPGRPRKVAT